MFSLLTSLVLCAGPKHPKNVAVLVCRVDHQDAKAPLLTFAPGTVLERVFENNDCTLAEGLRFIDSVTKQGEATRK